MAVSSSLAAAALLSNSASGAVTRQPKFSDDPFKLGVASGDPLSDGVVLWTRLAPKPLEGGGLADEPIEVSWQIADDEGMTRVVQKGTAVANPQWAHSVHVEVQGLRPDRIYWYQFRAGNAVSPKGRTRTMPAESSNPDRLRFAFASCQHYEAGFYTAYEHMLRDDVDLVVHLGDYIYEGGHNNKRKSVRVHVGPTLMNLDEYRNRHAQYKTDPALQAMHAATPWIVTWDDHEVSNNYAGVTPEHHPERHAEFLTRRAAGYQA